MYYSFDVFDTCIVRKCGDPKNVFELMSKMAFTKAVSESERQSFVAARIKAEVLCQVDYPTLSDIYAVFNYSHPSLKSIPELIELEMTVERETAVPVPALLKLISGLRASGHKVLFISDMYLGTEFIKDILRVFGFWIPDDPVYVSCDLKMSKSDGSLYRHIHSTQGILYHKWHHYGDHSTSDLKIPKQLGINVHKVNHGYSSFQKDMKLLPSLGYQWGSLLAGLGRSLRVQGDIDAHKDFVLDIIAPLYTSFVCRIMSDALKKGVSTLYFCARDAYPLYIIALNLQPHYQPVKPSYLPISRLSLYEGDDNAKLGFFKQCGLASRTEKNAIVDVRSSGKTLTVLNGLLENEGFNCVYGYLFELINPVESKKNIIYAEINDEYISSLSPVLGKLPNNWFLYELFFPLNTQKRTLGYCQGEDGFVPIYEDEPHNEFQIENLQEWAEWRNWAMDSYSKSFILLGLHLHANDVFTYYSIPKLANFFLYPNKHYLKALDGFKGVTADGTFAPYIDNSLWRFPLNIFRHKTIWKRGTIFYALPLWLAKRLYKKKG